VVGVSTEIGQKCAAVPNREIRPIGQSKAGIEDIEEEMEKPLIRPETKHYCRLGPTQYSVLGSPRPRSCSRVGRRGDDVDVAVTIIGLLPIACCCVLIASFHYRLAQDRLGARSISRGFRQL
jgi:hypothetical protein